MRATAVVLGWSRYAIMTKSFTTSPFTTDLKHLATFDKQTMDGAKKEGIPIRPVKDRIIWWNIVPGDKVRVLSSRSKPSLKGLHPTLPEYDHNKSGKNVQIKEEDVLEVLSVNRLTNEVLLKGVNYGQNEFERKNNTNRPAGTYKVPYFDCQLFLGWYTLKESSPLLTRVFARRVERSTNVPKWDKSLKRFVWNRKVVATIPPMEKLGEDFEKTLKVSPTTGKKFIEQAWPEEPVKSPPKENQFYDTDEETVHSITYAPPFWTHDPTVYMPTIPDVDHYINALHNKRIEHEDLGMETHLAVELSNPHSRVKKQRRWQDRQLYRNLLKTKIVEDEKINPMGRTKAEIEEDSDYKWRSALSQEELFERKRREFNAKRVTAIIHKRARRKRREKINTSRFNALTLQMGRNQVIPRSSKKARK